MRLSFDLDNRLSKEKIGEIKETIERIIDTQTKYYLAELRYELPEWFESKKDYPILNKTEIKELLDLGFDIVVTWGADDCYGYSIRIDLFDPLTELSLFDLDYREGWDNETTLKILQPFKDYKCKRIEIKELY